MVNLSSYKIGWNGRRIGGVQRAMRLAPTALCLCLAAQAESRLLVHNERGELLREAPVVFRNGGAALVSREALYGAASAAILDGQGGFHRVLWITSDDPDLGVLEIWAGAQLPAGPASSTDEKPAVLRFGDHDAHLTLVKEMGSTGIVGHLDCQHPVPVSGPLLDGSGMLSGWHVVRLIDGRQMSFAIPVRRIEMASRSVLISVEDWGRRHSAEREEPYYRALGHFWSNDFDGASFYFRKAIELDNTNARAWLHLGFAEGKQGRVREKLACLRRAIELEPKLDTAHYHLGLQLLLNGDHEGAESELDELSRLESPYGPRLETLIRTVHVDRLERDPKRKHPARPNHIKQGLASRLSAGMQPRL